MGKSKKFQRKKQENKNKAASASVSEENKNYYTLDLEIMAAFGVSIVHTHPQPLYTGPPVLNCAADPKNWDAYNKSLMEAPSKNVFNPSPLEPALKKYSDTLNLEDMAAFGVSIVHPHPQPLYTGPPVLNSAADPKNWDAFNKSLMKALPENVFKPCTPEPALKEYCDTHYLEAMPAFGSSMVHTHPQLRYTSPSVKADAADRSNRDSLNPYPCSYPNFAGP